MSLEPSDLGLAEESVPESRGFDSPILSEETFLALIKNDEVERLYAGYELAEIPSYDSWRIVAARFIPCARPTENVDGEILNVDMLDPAFDTQRISQICQLEHRLSAQPFDANGHVLPFALHIISRPYRSGDPRSHNLSRLMLADIRDVKATAGFDSPQQFDVYPNSTNSDVLTKINEHIVRFHGGGLLRTLAIMSSSEDDSKLAFWSGSGRNPEANEVGSFRFSSLIRPRQPGYPDERDLFQYLDTIGDTTAVTLDENANVLAPTPGDHAPSMFPFLMDPSDSTAQQQVLDLNNTRKFFLPNLDCVSCHGVSSHVTDFGQPLNGIGFSAEDPTITVTADPQRVLQSRASDFVALGYRTIGAENVPSVAQVLINDAAMTSSFINKSASFWNPQAFEEFAGDALQPAFRIQESDLMRNSRVVARQFAISTPIGAFALESGLEINFGEIPTFSFGDGFDEASLPLQLPAAEAQLVADLLQISDYREISHSSDDALVMKVLVNQRDEVFVERLE